MFRCLLATVKAMAMATALFFCATASADDQSPPPSLTSQEAAEGWIQLFDGESTFGWKPQGDVQVQKGVLVVGGKQASSAAFATEFAEFELKVLTDPGMGSLSIQRSNSHASVGLSNRPRRIHIKAHVGNEGASQVQTVSKPGADGIEDVTVNLSVGGPSRIKLEAKEGKTVAVRSLKLRPIGARPLFNGKDLSGWQVTKTDPKRLATRFTVTPQGELAARSGPGDLRTEKEFADFVLQFECKTNGKALNSGIFFRCMPNAYQNGYEAQIQNAYLLDRTKPLDYGTGAIYRRVKARKVVSNDREWFTMTVVARGPHIATWVNGYPTVDWIDTRKANDNPRKGLRTAGGHISIQGHDPTTDLLFRNIRILELPK